MFYCASDGNCYTSSADTCPGYSFYRIGGQCEELRGFQSAACNAVNAIASDNTEHSLTLTVESGKMCSFRFTVLESYVIATPSTADIFVFTKQNEDPPFV